MLTLFSLSIPKPFVQHVGVIRRNVGQLVRLSEDAQVVLIGSEGGIARSRARSWS